MKKILTWLLLLNKRILRKPAFLVLLVLIPLLVTGYSLIAGQESGVVTIALAQEGTDALARQVMEELVGSSELILFLECGSPDEATAKVAQGKADAAWIFPEDLEARMEAFTADPDRDNAVVQVVQREEQVLLMLTREVLGGKILDLCAERLYLGYVRHEMPELSDLTDGELLDYYNGTKLTGSLFAFRQTDGTPVDQGAATGYLMTPIRGLLAVVMLLCGLSTAMYHVRDRQLGTFSWVPLQDLPAVELAGQLVSAVDLSIAALICLLCAGLSGPLWQELAVIPLYSLCVAGFSMLLRRLCGSIRSLGVVMPLLMVAVLLICPVFFDLGALRAAQFLFPPTYYINAMYNSRYLLYMPVYSGVCLGLYWLWGKLIKRD